MTEAEWLACTEPEAMLEFLRGKASDRKLRLFSVACCRKIWDTLTDERLRRAVEVGEQYADGLVSDQTRSAAWDAVLNMKIDAVERQDWERAVRIRRTQGPVLDFMSKSARYISDVDWGLQCRLLRDILGNPFRPASIDPTVLTWNCATVPRMAQAISDDRAFDRLPILADALEEAGCSEPAILSHCRSGSEHVRGCWVIDLLLGRE